MSFDVARGRTVGLVGESGCGKTVTALSVMRLLPQPMGRVLGGEILLDGEDLLRLPLEEMRKVRGGRIGMIFQEPMTALNPVHRIGKQLTESFLLHQKITPAEATARAMSCWPRSASRRPRSASASTRTSSRAACASAW